MRILVVVNKNAGGSSSGLYDFVRHVGEAGCEVVLRFVGPGQRIEELLEDFASFDRLVAAGGDGTASAVLYTVRDGGVPVLAFPAGTANLLTSNLGLPLEAPALADIVLNDDPVAFDLAELEWEADGGELQRSGFAIIAGAGYDAAIMETAQPLKQNFGAAAYLMAAVTNLSPAYSRFRLTIDDRVVETDGIAVLLINFGRLQFDVPLTQASPCDGLLDVAVVRSKNVVGLLPAAVAAVLDRSGDHSDRGSGLDLYSASRVRVEADPPLRMQYDGDVLERSTPFTARVLDRAASLFVGKDSEFAKTCKS